MRFLFIEKGQTIRLAAPVPSGAIDHIPPKVYTIAVDDDGVFLAEKVDRFTLPEKIYGKDHEKKVSLVTKAWDPDGSVGAMFIGKKGTGKSLAAEGIANKMIDKGVPCIYIDTALPAGLVKHVIRSLGPCTVIFEEFGKLYPLQPPMNSPQPPMGPPVSGEQDQLLSLFSDSSLRGVIFLFTENDAMRLNQHLLGRPDRVKYHFRYTSPGYEEFEDLSKGYPIHEEIMEYVKFLLDCAGAFPDYGIDTLKVYRDAAINVPKLEDYIEKLSYMNVDAPISISYRIDQAYNAVTKKAYSNYAVTVTPTGARVDIFNDIFETTQSLNCTLDDVVFVNESNAGLLQRGLFKIQLDDWVFLGEAFPAACIEGRSFRWFADRQSFAMKFSERNRLQESLEKELLSEDEVERLRADRAQPAPVFGADNNQTANFAARTNYSVAAESSNMEAARNRFVSRPASVKAGKTKIGN